MGRKLEMNFTLYTHLYLSTFCKNIARTVKVLQLNILLMRKIWSQNCLFLKVNEGRTIMFIKNNEEF